MSTDFFTIMNNRSSVRSFVIDKKIPFKDQERIIYASQKSSSSFNLQTYSIISIEDKTKRKEIARLSGEQWFICDASLFWVFCVDLYKMKYVTKQAGYEYFQSKFLESTLMGVIDASLVAQTAATAAEALGYGICMIGGVRNNIDKLIDILNLPEKVFPVIGLCIGYPDRVNPPKKRLPIEGVFFKDTYNREKVEQAILKYDKEMADLEIYKGREFPINEVNVISECKQDKYGWIQHSGRRVATKNINKARVQLKQILNDNRIGLE